MQNNSTITVLGAGYVGLTTAALLAHAGYKVYLIEPNKKRLDTIKTGRSFFFEDGINPLISRALELGTLIPTDSYADSIPYSHVVFSCVGTPDNPDGSSNLTYVYAAAEETAKHLANGIYVQKSTVPVGTGRKVAALLPENVDYVSNPEFLREGTAVYDTLFFDRVIAGSDSQESVAHILDIYRDLESSRHNIAELAQVKTSTHTGEYISTNLESAELIKVTANAFLALKISFANSIAKLADKAGADVKEVMSATGADARIGRAFLNAGRGYGGGCFPKDVSGLIASAHDYGVDLKIMEAAQEVNQSMPDYIIAKMREAFDRDLEGVNITVLGLAFKAGTSDVRKSPGITLANKLANLGAHLKTYDPAAREEASEDLTSSITQQNALEDALAGSDIVIIATNWQEFVDYPADSYMHHMSGTLFIDAVNAFDAQTLHEAGLTYVGVGR